MLDIYNNFGYIGDLVKQQPDKIKARLGNPPQLEIKSLPHLNKMIWGFEKKKLITLGARPGNGKSVWMLQIAYDLALQGHLVHFYSFEMTKDVCAARLFSNRCSVDNITMKNGRYAEIMDIEREKKCREEFFKEAENLKFMIFESIGKSLPQLKEIYERVKPWPDVIFIDYGNLVEQQEFKSRKNVYDDYIKGLRVLAVQNDVCVVMGAQIGRNVQKKDGGIRPPELEDFKETGVLEEQSDQCILLFWPWLSDKERPFNEFDITVAKNRDGRTGLIPCIFYPEYSKIIEDKVKIDNAKKEKEQNGQPKQRN